MSPELDKKLVEAYPKIFSERNGDMKETAMFWGFTHGDGWYDLLERMCFRIQRYIDLNPHLKVQQVVATQVKEKYGALSFYFYGGDEYIEGLVDFASETSITICEICGNRGALKDNDGWLITRCQEHL